VPVTELPPGGLGSAITPEQWASYVLEHLSAQSVVLASGATRIVTAQRQVHVPRVLSDGAASWYGELEEIDENGPTGDELVLTPKKVAELVKLSSEVVDDSSPSVLDTVGTAMTRAVALTADRAILTGTGGKQPLGVYGQAGQHVVAAAVSIDSLIDAAGLVADVGGQARVAYVHPADHTALMKEKDQNGRPLLTPDYSGGPSSTIYGLALGATKGVAQGTALVAAPEQIIVAVRQDPSVAVSTDALFTADGAVARVIARIDCGVNDPNGLVSIAATATTETEGDGESKSESHTRKVRA
jgi:HK97 family phage major capsid protein